MDVAKLVLEYVQALVWPLFVLLLMIFFRGEFRELLHRLKSAKGAGLEAEFGEEFRDVEAESREAIAEEGVQAVLSLEQRSAAAAADAAPESKTAQELARRQLDMMERLIDRGILQKHDLDEASWDALTALRDQFGLTAGRGDLAAPRVIYTRLSPLVREHPEAAILSAWRDVEMAVDGVFANLRREAEAQPLNREARRRLPMREKLEALRRAGLGGRAARSMEELLRLNSPCRGC